MDSGETSVRFTINLRSSQQQGRYAPNTPNGIREEVEKSTFNAINYVVQDIAFKAAKTQQRNVQNQIEAKLSGIAMSEISKMGRKIASLALGIGPAYRFPKGGNLEIEGPISTAFKRMDRSAVEKPMSIEAVTGQWRARTQEYLQRKSKKYGHRRWWLNTGELKREIRNPGMWIGAYGPIRVSFRPTRIDTGHAKGGVLRYSNLARGAGRSYTIQVGELHMTVLGRITREMLNSPGQRSYDSRFTGLFDSLPESVEKKLASRGDPFRPIIEPFLTFYLNRQIPNRIWSELEKSIKPLGVGR